MLRSILTLTLFLGIPALTPQIATAQTQQNDLEGLLDRASKLRGQDNAQAANIASQAVTTARQRQDTYLLAKSLWILTQIQDDLKQHEAAQTSIAEALALAKSNPQAAKLKSVMQISQRVVLINLARAAENQPEKAALLYKKSLQVATEIGDRTGQSISHLGISQAYWRQQRFNDALPDAQKAVELSNGEDLFQVTALMNLGRIYDDATDFKKATAAYERAFQQGQKTNIDRTFQAATQNNLGLLYLHLGNVKESETLITSALTTAQQTQTQFRETLTTATIDRACKEANQDPNPLPNQLLTQFCGKVPQAFLLQNVNQSRSQYFQLARKLEATSRNNLGVFYRDAGNYPKALEQQQIALRIDQEIDPQGGATGLNNLANISISTGDYPGAIATFEQSLVISRRNKFTALTGRTLNNLGLVYAAQGDYRKAIATAESGLKLVREAGDRVGEATALDNLGNHHQQLGDYKQAQTHYAQALAIHQATGSKSGEANVLSNIAVLADTKGDYSSGQKHHQQAIALFRSIGEREKEGASLANQARAAEDQGQYSKALDLYVEALTIHRAIGNKDWESTTLGNLGGLHRALGKPTQALDYYNQALKIAQGLGDRATEATILTGLASAHQDLQNYAAAKTALDQSLQLNRQIGSRRPEIYALRSLGLLYGKQAQTPQALEQLTQAVAKSRSVGLPPEEALVLADLSQAQLKGNQLAAAQQSAQQSAAIAAKIGDRPTQAKALTTLGQTQLLNGQAAAASQSFSQAANLWEGLRPGLSDSNKVSLFELQTQTYSLWQQSLVAQNQSDAALEVSERGRARAFVELFATKLRSSTPEIPKLAEIRAIAQQHRATLVQYAQASDRELYIWVIKPDGTIRFYKTDLGNQSLETRIQATRDGLNVRGRASIAIAKTQGPTSPSPTGENNLRSLHQLLIDPIAADLPSNPEDQVIFLPQGPLLFVPFAALEDAGGKALIDRHTLSVAPAIQSLALTDRAQQKTAQGSGPALIVGNPTMANFANLVLPPLPGAEKEAKAIAPLFSTQALVGGAATKAVVLQKMAQARLIHLATHGLLDTVRGEVPGALALAPDNAQDDGLLSAGEIAQLQLRADLVVLSACSTGQGDLTGDGVIGLSRSLFLAGVPSVVVSLWDVSDDSTALLMTEFYKHLAQKKLSKAQALRQAMLTTRQKYPDPKLWAAFNLIGEFD
jgi:CHAT domain-containing protein/tetratricopeptide (TPR) repeat protein